MRSRARSLYQPPPFSLVSSFASCRTCHSATPLSTSTHLSHARHTYVRMSRPDDVSFSYRFISFPQLGQFIVHSRPSPSPQTRTTFFPPSRDRQDLLSRIRPQRAPSRTCEAFQRPTPCKSRIQLSAMLFRLASSRSRNMRPLPSLVRQRYGRLLPYTLLTGIAPSQR